MTVSKARSKGLKTGAALVGTILLSVFTWWWLWMPAAGYTGYLGYQWLKYRGKYGMRF